MKQKIEKKAGASLAIVMIILTLFTAFSLSLMQGGSLLLSQANRRVKQERCYQLAQSFSKALESELTKHTVPDVVKNPEAVNSFYLYAYKFLIGIYGEYDPDHPDTTTYHYTAASGGGDEASYGKIKVVLRKEQNQEMGVPLSGTMEGKNADAVENTTFRHYDFTVDVIAELDDLTYTYRTEYHTEEKYRVQYKGIVDGSSDVTLVHVGENVFRMNSSEGAVFDSSDMSKIKYSYITDEVTECMFVKSYAE